MADPHPQQSIEWLNWYNQQYGPPQKDPSAVPRLTRAIADYLHWMKSVNYTPASRHQHRMQLELFLSFVKNRRFGWQQLFTEKTREHFKKIRGLSTTAAVNGLSRYLVGQGQLKTPLPQHPQQRKLAGIFEDYLQYRQDGHQTDTRQLKSIRRVLSALCDYFNQHGITLQPASYRRARCLYGRVLPALFAGHLQQLSIHCARLFKLSASATRHLKKRSGAASHRCCAICQSQAPEIFTSPRGAAVV